MSLFTAALGVAAALYPVEAQEPGFVPVTDEVLQNPDPADWLRWRRDHTNSAYSPLDQINRENVQNLRLAWAWAMGDGQQEQEPIVYKGVMYLPHADSVVQALDARTGELIWEYRPEFPEEGEGDSTRNISIYRDKVFVTLPDARLVALNVTSGSVLWETKVADHTQRISFSSGPIAGDGKVFAGLTCGVGSPSACSLSAYDAETGKQLWRRESVAGPGDPEEHNATWGGVPYEGRKKSSFWLTGSYDPDLNLLYWTTASAYPYPELLKGTGSGALLYTNSILALNAETGTIKWFYQMQPRDNFDMDHQDNPILGNVEIDGTQRKAVFTLGKPGILWAFDRETGTHLWNRQLVPYQNIYQRIDPKTGAITKNEQIIPKEVGEAQLVCPGMRGGKLFQTHAFNPKTNMLYSPVSNACSIFEVVPLDVNASGVDYNRIQHMEGSGGKVGRLAAVSASTGELRWTYDQRAAMGSVLTTAGALVFVGDLHRYFRALDAETGKLLWEIPLSAPVTGYPISYAADGKQYVAVAVGGRTSGQRHMGQLYPELKAPVGSNVLMVFALGD
ncbi:PQQ-binding-like beta-propeller repeat protein [Acidobacteria bacterium AH-259-D05]|nr:PQQ-binding-like beta-propeller repeat protein [Acidobacteria bacterium AH-259-D05]